jgi:hypothetical protein
MHSWHIAFQSLFQNFEPYPSKNICSNAFSQNFRYKRFSERKYFKMSSIVMELSYIFYGIFPLENHSGKIIILTS